MNLSGDVIVQCITSFLIQWWSSIAMTFISSLQIHRLNPLTLTMHIQQWSWFHIHFVCIFTKGNLWITLWICASSAYKADHVALFPRLPIYNNITSSTYLVLHFHWIQPQPSIAANSNCFRINWIFTTYNLILINSV